MSYQNLMMPPQESNDDYSTGISDQYPAAEAAASIYIPGLLTVSVVACPLFHLSQTPLLHISPRLTRFFETHGIPNSIFYDKTDIELSANFEYRIAFRRRTQSTKHLLPSYIRKHESYLRDWYVQS
ncbi:Protein of unknown function [Pyronema omphalodes CBS 100304]|uniref:Uncharacterized protein n=1 Tax=Pyronema omphalodes (strain CBS 100304) TaxID=1076935 RepID=U4LP99_PYROM|nr:Protein of unknown function [Pyronema omphalodes CBS 100304]